MATKKKDDDYERLKRGFIGVPTNLFDSPAWNDLDPWAQRLFLMYEREYRGSGNGDLNIQFAEAKEKKQFNSPKTFYRCHNDLWEHGFLIMTRYGGYGTERSCNLWGLTTHAIKAIPEKGIIAGDRMDDWKLWPGKSSLNYSKLFPTVEANRKANEEMRQRRMKEKAGRSKK
jgi:hypothetical protein